MITNCPHCKQSLQLGASHTLKIQKALDDLQPGKRLTIRCPNCKKPIILDKNNNENEDQQSLSEYEGPKVTSGVQPPSPPDLEWLKNNSFKDEELEEDVPMALVLYPDNQNQKRVIASLETVGYRVICDKNAIEAVDRMSFINFACIVLHSNFENMHLDESGFHEYMKNMNMRTRRYIFYILIGQEFHTLYNLEALSNSANLVINDKDLKYLDVILRQSIPAHEILFGAIMEEMAAYGKR
jgi:uncharacterized protein YbaR (Trm112 family)